MPDITAEVSINDSEYIKYTAVTPGIIEQYGGKFVVRVVTFRH